MPYFSQIRRRSISAVVAMFASGFAPGLGAQSKVGAGKVTIAVAGKAACHFLPLTIAAQLGYFAAEGLDVTITDFPDEAAAFQSLGAGGDGVVIFPHIRVQDLDASRPVAHFTLCPGGDRQAP